MQINTVQQASRQELQDEVLSLIRSRSAATGPAARKPAERTAALEKNEGAVAAPVGQAQTETAVREINETLRILATSLRFEVDQESHRTLVKVVDRDTGEVLRQIPSEATIQIARTLDKLVGHLIDHSI